MLPHHATGRAGRALRSVCLPLIFLLCAPNLLAQGPAGGQNAPDDEYPAAAQPAPEPDTWLLLGSGALLLLALFARQQMRERATRPSFQSSPARSHMAE